MSDRVAQDRDENTLNSDRSRRAHDHDAPSGQELRESGKIRSSSWSRVQELLRRHFIAPLTRSEHPPWFDARGAAVGFFIALGMPVGSHMLIMGTLRLVFRFNFLIAFAFSWIINPFTILPIYYADYWLGSLLLAQPEVLTTSGFGEQVGPIIHSKHFVESLKAFLFMDLHIMKLWALGAFSVATVSSILVYLATLWLQRRRRTRRSA